MSALARARLGDQAASPLVVLTLVAAVGQFDVQVLNVFTPEITADLHTSAATLGLLYGPLALVAMLAPLVFGYLGDHVNRVRLVMLSLGLWIVAALLTSTATALGLLLLYRVVGAVSKGANGVEASLLADYYPTKVRGLAYGAYSSAGLWGSGLAAVAAGFVGDAWGWRAAFAVFAVPAIVLVPFGLRLRDPGRGVPEAVEAGVDEPSPASPLGPVRTARVLLKIPSFRWLCAGAAVGFSAVAMSGPALSYYYSTVFDVPPIGRGFLTAAALPCSLLGLFLGGIYGQRLLERGRSHAVVAVASAVNVGAATCYLVVATADHVWVAALGLVLAQALTATVGVPLYLCMASLVPASVRSQAFGVLGSSLLVLTPIAAPIGLSLGDELGFRYSVLAAAPLLVVAAGCLWIASRFVRDDVARALRASLAETHARRRRADGEVIGILDIRDLTASYGAEPVLIDVGLHVGDGETVAIVGANGAGKSTLLRALNGLVIPTGGMVLLDGEDVSGLEAEDLAHRGIVTVPAGGGIFPRLTVQQHLELGRYARPPGSERTEGPADIAELFPSLAGRERQLAGSLSGGEQQMLILGQAFLGTPRLLLVDELTHGLGAAVVDEVVGAVRAMQARGTAMVIVEQDVELALELADRVYVLVDGRIAFGGTPSDLRERPDLLRSVFFVRTAP